MSIPLAERLRPNTLEEFVGQDHLFGPKGLLTQTMERKVPSSLLFWGPPGSGKTTIARLYAKAFQARVIELSAVSSGISDIKNIVKEIYDTRFFNQTTMVFVDEIHRFNKAQQDAFLPHLEKGTFFLIAATTENPSFTLNNALLSRLHVLTLHSLKQENLESILKRLEIKEQGIELDDTTIQVLIDLAQGDARCLLNMIEVLPKNKNLNTSELLELYRRKLPLYDRKGDGHFHLISALHKSIRGSDPDASLYWFCRMLDAGEEPLYIARRLIRIATEDIGLADPQALPVSIAARKSYEVLGSPEGELALAQLVIYLALAPKSDSIYKAFKDSMELARKTGTLSPPKSIINSSTRLMSSLGYGEGYIYDHNCPDGFSGQDYFPQELSQKEFYKPIERGFEREMKKRLDYFRKIKIRKNKKSQEENG